ncbi:MAG: hypothetical protein RR902_01350, partial [Oscillospiraceae bacterium]
IPLSTNAPQTFAMFISLKLNIINATNKIIDNVANGNIKPSIKGTSRKSKATVIGKKAAYIKLPFLILNADKASCIAITQTTAIITLKKGVLNEKSTNNKSGIPTSAVKILVFIIFLQSK